MLRIVFMGTPQFSVPILEALIEKYNVVGVVTQPDKEVGRKRILQPTPVKECAIKHNIKVLQPTKIKTEYQEILDLNPDLIVTAAYGQIIGKEVLNYPKYKCINVHASLLPLYRGGAPIHKAIMDGRDETGVTIMYMASKMDAGDILSQRSMPITDEDNCGIMFEKLSYLGRDLLLETLPLLIEGKITPIKQDEEKVEYAYNISKEEERLDLTKDARSVFNHIRGLNPAPGAYMLLQEEPLKIYEANIVNYKHNKIPGEIFIEGKNKVYVACGNNTTIELITIKPFGKGMMKASDFANGGLKKYLN